MIMADVLTWFLLILGVYLVLNAHWLGAYALAPALVERSRQRYDRRPVAATLLGLAVAVPVALIGINLMTRVPHPLTNLLVLGMLAVPLLIAFAGSAGLALRIGNGLGSPADAAQPWRRVLRGGAVLGLVFLMPVLGWFVLLPWTLVSGLGAGLMAWREPHAVPLPASATETVDTVLAAPKA
jgi:hypothetical protein